jgi:hypothetical protein
MATPITSKPGPGIITVQINVDPNKKEISVSLDPFEVSKGRKEQVEWVCGQNHGHDDPKGCFWVHFDKECPFDKKEAHFHKELSGPPNAASVIDKKYKYTVEIPGYPLYPPLDPIGIVRQ